MRILLVSQEYPPETAHGGIATQTHAKARGLAARGHDVTVLSASITAQRTVCESEGVKVVRIPGAEGRLPSLSEEARWVTWSVEVAAAIKAQLDERSVDLIDVPEYGGEAYVHLLSRGLWDTTPVVVHLHGPLVMLADRLGWPAVDSELFRTGTLMEATSVRLADAVVSSSEESRRWCAEHYAAAAAEAPVIHLGVDTRRFSPGPRVTNRPTVVFVGRVSESKGVLDLTAAAVCAATDLPGLRLVLAGRDQDGCLGRVMKLAADGGHPNLIDARGAVARDELLALLRDADVFAAPSHQEGGPGFVYLEAMACGLPVIGCSGSGIDEIIEHGVTGSLVPPRDVDALTRELHALLGDEKRRAAIGLAARERATSSFDTEVCLDRLEAFYREVVR
jgi:glycosyltransferase involved in cell wall biosynthesis